MNTPSELDNFLICIGSLLFTYPGPIEAKTRSTIEDIGLSDAERMQRIAELNALLAMHSTDHDLNIFWDRLNASVGFDDGKTVRWWLAQIIAALEKAA